jgi:glycosyltransferase involved in cell wall biosynthesis
VRFVGHVPEEELARLYQSATALVVTAEEDWGLTAVEANAFGCPVLAAAHGGNLETVIDGETGVLFPPRDLPALRSAIESISRLPVDRVRLRSHAASFSHERFRKEILEWIGSAVA